ncbi:MAG: hypothetical protein WCK17_17145, partial [Verrucomicrobiota bacterium]
MSAGSASALTFAEETMWRRLILTLTLGAIAGIFVIPLNPVNSKTLKLAFLGCIVGGWTGCTILGRGQIKGQVSYRPASGNAPASATPPAPVPSS